MQKNKHGIVMRLLFGYPCPARLPAKPNSAAMTFAKLLLVTLSLCMLAVQAPASVVAIYSFDGQKGKDVSGNNNHATGSVSYSANTPFGNGFAYSVNANKLTASHASGSSFDTINTSLSVSFWINATTTGNDNWFRVVRKGAGSTANNNWIINRYNATADTNIRIDSGDTGNGFNQNLAYTSSGGSVLDGSWHLVTYVLNYTSGTTGTVLEYLDGNLVSPNTGNAFIFGNGLNNTHALEIGVSSGNWTGMLDDLGIWSNALTTGEARSIYTLADNDTFAYDLELVTQLHALHAE